MKIINRRNEVQFPMCLHETKPGQCVQFAHGFNNRHADDAKFLVLKVPTGYIAEEKRVRNDEYRVMVANLDTGLTSLVLQDRRVRIVNAHVTVDE